ncbi:MAG: signal transduction histidine kinase [Enterobacterales bacterium]|jgi:signal transduction histidine kinase
MSGLTKKTPVILHLPKFFLGLMAMLSIALLWLGWLLMEQDRSLQIQRTEERLDLAAVEIAEAFSLNIENEQHKIESSALSLNTSPLIAVNNLSTSLKVPSTLLLLSTDQISTAPETSLRYLPNVASAKDESVLFKQADNLELKQHDDAAAIEYLTPLSRSEHLQIKASALLRLGRISYRNKRFKEALDYYELLTQLNKQYIRNRPVDWLALYARCKIFEQQQSLDSLAIEALRLSAVLKTGGRKISKATYQYYAIAVNRWLKLSKQSMTSGINSVHTASEATIKLHGRWLDLKDGHSVPLKPDITGSGKDKLITLWSYNGAHLLAGLYTVEDIHIGNFATVTSEFEQFGIGWNITYSDNDVLISGLENNNQPESIHIVNIQDLQFTISTFKTAAMNPLAADVMRRQLLLFGLFAVIAVLAISTYFISRSLRREAEFTQLQSNFVSAVSHEFRTPLTSIKQLSELLASERISEPAKAKKYHQIIVKESTRLQRLVEELLDFGRMEAGAHHYHSEVFDCTQVLNETVLAFREENQLDESELSLLAKDELKINFDRKSLIRAVWNILDNALKYSTDDINISVVVTSLEGYVLVSIKDHGVGFLEGELTHIFNKFERGSAAIKTQVRGTGLGLALVKEIVEQQEGMISAKSVVGKGATFTISLKMLESQ